MDDLYRGVFVSPQGHCTNNYLFSSYALYVESIAIFELKLLIDTFSLIIFKSKKKNI